MPPGILSLFNHPLLNLFGSQGGSNSAEQFTKSLNFLGDVGTQGAVRMLDALEPNLSKQLGLFGTDAFLPNNINSYMAGLNNIITPENQGGLQSQLLGLQNRLLGGSPQLTAGSNLAAGNIMSQSPFFQAFQNQINPNLNAAGQARDLSNANLGYLASQGFPGQQQFLNQIGSQLGSSDLARSLGMSNLGHLAQAGVPGQSQFLDQIGRQLGIGNQAQDLNMANIGHLAQAGVPGQNQILSRTGQQFGIGDTAQNLSMANLGHLAQAGVPGQSQFLGSVGQNLGQQNRLTNPLTAGLEANLTHGLPGQKTLADQFIPGQNQFGAGQQNLAAGTTNAIAQGGTPGTQSVAGSIPGLMNLQPTAAPGLQSNVQNQLLGEMGTRFNPASAVDPSVTRFANQTLQSGGVGNDVVSAFKNRVYQPQRDMLLGELNRKGVLDSSERLRQEEDLFNQGFMEPLLLQAQQNAQNAANISLSGSGLQQQARQAESDRISRLLGLGSDLSGQQFGQGISNQQLRLSSMGLGGQLQNQLAGQGLGAAQLQTQQGQQGLDNFLSGFQALPQAAGTQQQLALQLAGLMGGEARANQGQTVNQVLDVNRLLQNQQQLAGNQALAGQGQVTNQVFDLNRLLQNAQQLAGNQALANQGQVTNQVFDLNRLLQGQQGLSNQMALGSQGQQANQVLDLNRLLQNQQNLGTNLAMALQQQPFGQSLQTAQLLGQLGGQDFGQMANLLNQMTAREQFLGDFAQRNIFGGADYTQRLMQMPFNLIQAGLYPASVQASQNAQGTGAFWAMLSQLLGQ